MIRAFLPALAMLAVLAANPAAAQDPRLVERLYDPDEVVVIQGKTKVQATIEFGEGEAIENVAVGDSTAWQVTPNQRANLLFVKPLSPSAQTNMTVVTNRHTYLFDLVASPRAKPLYMMRFTYPEPPPEEQEAQLAENAVGEANAIELAAATDPLAVVDPAMLNFKWQAKGERQLQPDEVYDDGRSTYLRWNQDRPVPAILIENYEGEEGPVNSTVRGDTVIVDGVPREIILRSGRERATLVNNGPARATAASGPVSGGR
ncbi:TrbG/VirB9 family P-type conjugative transfer protein [Citromicrobium sp. JLT1363]|uniref:TrbG/VirB9 family P-type conjugative transfer protein n=1 Tax=Citromicrobium sp. JLT1363 TaxID=517722 RepID=UPI0003000EF4|nr:TrbG/VirB9 family P-type conjugative transfer protein [Citromicrobium sp. JLT1363]